MTTKEKNFVSAVVYLHNDGARAAEFCRILASELDAHFDHNCNECPAKPASAWPYMSQLARKYLKEEFGFAYHSSLFSMKPILKASELDDSRPTVVRVLCDEPRLVSVLSGKINTVYDLDEVLEV